ncbi:hypothetical protein B0H63DRAFT_122412 [Podospora didyma]|uniref:Uncharacterized protein n=1 Tax=Podospora didyma TaxID=330526 RepID=A0AAE0U4I7_9PEZI|nr:hypothetical protein B0H63DRAFT_122412 [Podospora didyma]
MIEARRCAKKRCLDIKPLLPHARHYKSSDMRDRVYAFISLLPKMVRIRTGLCLAMPSPNNIVHVLLDTAQKIVQQKRSLDLLRHVHRGRENLGNFLPTWVPDWTSRETEDMLWRYLASEAPEVVGSSHASTMLASEPEFRKHADDEAHFDLKVTGFKLYSLDEDDGPVPGFDGLQRWAITSNAWQEGPAYAVTLSMGLMDNEYGFCMVHPYLCSFV